MCQMLLSINPEYVDRILSGQKIYEYRKFRCREDVNKIVIYATSPRKEVVAEADVVGIVEDSPQIVWELTHEYSGITYRFFKQYYKGKNKAVAYKLDNIVVYDKPRSLAEIGVSHAPQSYRYLEL